jgi:hypothetical protein
MGSHSSYGKLQSYSAIRSAILSYINKRAAQWRLVAILSETGFG